MTLQPLSLELALLKQALTRDFTGLIVGVGSGSIEKERNFLSKAIAAYVLTSQAGASLEQAAKASIDGGSDHGIDSVYRAEDNTLWLVQSKYLDSGRGEPNLGDVSKFHDGVTDLLHGKYERFNLALQARTDDLTSVLSHENCKVKVVLAYTGTSIADDRRNIFSNLERAFNGTNPGFLKCLAYGLTTLHGFNVDNLASQPIEAEIELSDFGCLQAPYKVFYGRITAKKLAELGRQFGDALVEKNIRRFKGSTAVNEGLRATLIAEPEHFFYFNNGVTFLCATMNEIHPRDANRLKGRFRIKGLSIINGAQTVGAIAKEPIAHYDTKPVEVLATFVCLESAPDTFGDRVTEFRNSQNSVDLQDFAALDENQLSWRETLSLASVEYIFKQGIDDPPNSITAFSVREAAPALACCQTGADWIDYLIAAKTDQKRLYKRDKQSANPGPLASAYFRLFPDSLTASELWRCVQISRFVHEAVKARAAAEAPVDKEILSQGRWLILHIISIKMQLRIGATLELTQSEKIRLSKAIDTLSDKLLICVKSQIWNKQTRSVFESKTDCIKVKSLVMQSLTQPL